MAEIDRIRLLWPRPFIEFADDNAFVNQAWWRDLLPELAKRRIKWFAETDVSIADDPELLTLMRRAGCAQVLIGFESPVESGLDGIELRRNWKWSQRARYADAIATIQSHGIRVNACFVVGLDGHGPGIFDAIYGFVEETAPFDVQITYPTPFPGTPLDRQLRRENRLTHDRQWNRCTLFDLNFTPRDMTADQLRRGFHDLTRRLYCEAFTDYRRRHFKAQLQACHQSLE